MKFFIHSPFLFLLYFLFAFFFFRVFVFVFVCERIAVEVCFVVPNIVNVVAVAVAGDAGAVGAQSISKILLDRSVCRFNSRIVPN